MNNFSGFEEVMREMILEDEMSAELERLVAQVSVQMPFAQVSVLSGKNWGVVSSTRYATFCSCTAPHLHSDLKAKIFTNHIVIDREISRKQSVSGDGERIAELKTHP